MNFLKRLLLTREQNIINEYKIIREREIVALLNLNKTNIFLEYFRNKKLFKQEVIT